MTVSVGTLRALQQIATPDGVFTIAAMDQRTALKRLLNPGVDLPYAEIRALKIDVARALSPHASGILLDPEFGAAECIASGALAGRCGLIVSVEVSGYTTEGTGRLATLIPGWSVAKIKRMGAQAAKILIYYHPDEVQAARRQRDLVARVLEDCRTWDLPLLVEAVSYPRAGQDAATFAAGKPSVVVRTAEELAPLGFDILKAEFPVDFSFFPDEAAAAAWCRKLDAASPMPWIVLSAGVDIDQFVPQVEIACRNGASGFLAGRAIWKESVLLPARAARQTHLQTQAVANLQRCTDLAIAHATPFQRKLGFPDGFSSFVSEGWYSAY
jgi:tagatose 1,6-diphosphate aldolase